MPEPMTLEEAVAYLDRLHERAEPESFMETFGDMTNFCAAFDALLAHARATLAQRREGVSACERCKGTGWAYEFFTSGPQSGGVRYVACGCGTRGAVIANEYTKASATEGVTEANTLDPSWSLDNERAKARRNSWYQAAMMLGEKLGRNGPPNYYEMSLEDWYIWATAALAASGEGA